MIRMTFNSICSLTPLYRPFKIILPLFLSMLLLAVMTMTLNASGGKSVQQMGQAKSKSFDRPSSTVVASTSITDQRHTGNDGALSQFDIVSFSENEYSWSVAWGDVDGDGDLDLAVGNSDEANQLYFNDGIGNLTLSPNALGTDSENTRSVAWGDVDGDGDLDLAVGNYGKANQLYLNDGTGNLTLSPNALGTDSENTRSVAWGDVNRDGYLDLAVGNYGEVNQLYLNDGTGGFALSPNALGVDSERTTSVAWGDVNRDGYLDLAVGNYGESNQLYLNDGTGGFALSPNALGVDSERTTSVAWGDVNRDGYLDLAVGNYGESNQLYLNDGTGSFLSPSVLGIGFEYTMSVAWGDADGDGDLDIAIGNAIIDTNEVYFNVNNVIEATTRWTSGDYQDSSHVAWGDIDGDGDLDLTAVNGLDPSKVYKNIGSVLNTVASFLSTNISSTMSIAWGDVDKDGDLDLAVGNDGVNRLYLNNGRGDLSLVPNALGTYISKTNSVAWGDVNRDGYLDLVVGNDGVNQLYLNDRTGNLSLVPNVFGVDTSTTRSVAWGDVNGDAYLDLVVGNYGQANQVYLNEGVGTAQFETPYYIGENISATTSIALGDVDGDGDLDLAVGNDKGQSNEIYFNVNNVITEAGVLVMGNRDWTQSVAWGDADGDGDLDLATGNGYSADKVYWNINGVLTTENAWNSGDANQTASVAWGDVNGDGYLDLAVGRIRFGEPGDGQNKLFLNISGTLQTAAENPWHSEDNWSTYHVAWADIDGDGDIELTAGNASTYNRVYPNSVQGGKGLPTTMPFLTVKRPITAAVASFYAPAPLITQTVIPISYTLFDHEGDSVSQIKAEYSLNGGGQWFPAVATSTTITSNLTASAWPTGTPHTYGWDTSASGFFGRSNNVIFRIIAYPQTETPLLDQSLHYTDSVPFPLQRPFVSAVTLPFQVRGTQVRVMSGTMPVSNAFVYRLPVSLTVGAEPMGLDQGAPFLTDGDGYLLGNGIIENGDSLFAMLPITASDSYTVYATNIQTSTDQTVAGKVVTDAGVQEITVSADKSLTLFHLKISLEWDARQDTTYMTELKSNLERASELLFDWSNGQMALGNIEIYHNRYKWEEADVQILVNNRYGPNADKGGIVTGIVTETLILDSISVTPTYSTGKVRIGATWSRSGESVNEFSEDWSRAFTHELGHYLLYLDDNYYGFNDSGLLIDIDTCSGVMGDPYKTSNGMGEDEFHSDTDWLPSCRETSSHQSVGRSDWATIEHFYHWVDAPDGTLSAIDEGPRRYSLATTQISEFGLGVPDLLSNPYFSLFEEGGGRYVMGDRIQAYLIRQGERVVSLGGGALGLIHARGAETDDLLCVQDLNKQDYGCKHIEDEESRELEIDTQSSWQPEVILSSIDITRSAILTAPVLNTTTLEITVMSNSAVISLSAQIYPFDGMPTIEKELEMFEDGAFTGSFVISRVVPSAAIHIRGVVSDGAGMRDYHFITDYALGGNPDCWSAGHCQNGQLVSTSIVATHNNDSNIRPAPVYSTDGLAFIAGKELSFEKGDFYILRAANQLALEPVWATAVGQAYRLERSSDDLEFDNANIQIRYLQRELPLGVTEHELFVYYYSDEDQIWIQLPTTRLHGVANTVSAPLQDKDGVYVVMAVIEAPALTAGWNLFAYPHVGKRPIAEALSSLNKDVLDCFFYCYTTVYHQEGGTWFLYDQTITREHPEFAPVVNKLTSLDSLNSYWIYATKDITPLIKPREEVPSGIDVDDVGALPPATFYGEVVATPHYTPDVGDVIVAMIGDKVCGKTVVQKGTATLATTPIYIMQVKADYGDNCGVIGREVKFVVGAYTFPATYEWNNRQACYHPLGVGSHEPCFVYTYPFRSFLPFIYHD